MKTSLRLALALSVASIGFCATDTDKAPTPEPRYNTATVVDVRVTVADVREVPEGSPMAGIHLTIQSLTNSYDVYVGPAKFVKMFDITFAKGDDLHIIGSKVNFEGAAVVLAKEIIRGKVALSLRDDSGEPLWKFFMKPPVG